MLQLWRASVDSVAYRCCCVVCDPSLWQVRYSITCCQLVSSVGSGPSCPVLLAHQAHHAKHLAGYCATINAKCLSWQLSHALLYRCNTRLQLQLQRSKSHENLRQGIPSGLSAIEDPLAKIWNRAQHLQCRCSKRLQSH